MKPTLLLAALTLAAVTTVSTATTELEMLLAQRAQIDRQIQSLQQQDAAPQAPVRSAASYVVKKGDSIERIARKTGITPTALARQNGLKTTSIIHPGQRLQLPGSQGETATAAPEAKAATAAVTQRYKVSQGETFYSIAKKHGVSTKSLMAANPTVKANALRPGMSLNIKSKAAAPARHEPANTTTTVLASKPKTPEVKQVAKETAAPAPKETASAPAKENLAPQPPAPAPSAAQNPAPAKKEVLRPITIDGEMTYGQFAQKHGTNPARLNELNGLDLTDATLLAKGSELYIPAQP